jgi:hypothetical protein
MRLPTVRALIAVAARRIGCQGTIGIDSSTALATIASKYSGVPCSVIRIEEMIFSHCFDGVWACASLVHFPKHVLPNALNRIHSALVPGGVLFATVQEGAGTKVTPDGRFYAYYQLSEFLDIVSAAGFTAEEAWRSQDVLRGPTQSPWINVLARADP